MKKPYTKREKQDYRVLNDMLNEARKKYLKAEIRMQMFLNNHKGTECGDYTDTDRIMEEINEKIKQENNY
jgi:polysaccharide deacetylase 2 family uncharacterized protein YibQ